MNLAPTAFLSIKVVPNASRNQIAKWENQTLTVRIQSPPNDGKANKELIAYLSKCTGLPQNGIAIKRGGSGRQKLIAFNGIDRTGLLSLLEIKD